MASCAALQAAGADRDAYYNLVVKGVIFKAWCRGMATASPKEYIDVAVSLRRMHVHCLASCRT